MENQTLLELLAAYLPPAFVHAMNEGMRAAYKEAHARATQDPAWGDESGQYLYGHFRHVFSNELLLDQASKHNLKTERQQTETESTDYVWVACGPFAMTVAHTATPGAVPEKASYRTQYSDINQHLPQQQLFVVKSKPKKQTIYVILSHGESREGELGHFEFGFPNQGCKSWADRISLQDVIDAQAVRYQKADDLQAQVQKPKPKLKENKQETQKKG